MTRPAPRRGPKPLYRVVYGTGADPDLPFPDDSYHVMGRDNKCYGCTTTKRDAQNIAAGRRRRRRKK